MKNSCSLFSRLWQFFLVFSVLILVMLWAFQGLFLNNFYEYEKTNEIKKIAKVIKEDHNSNDFENTINDLSFEKEICVEIVDKDLSIVYSSTFFGKGCMHPDGNNTNYKEDFIKSNNKENTFQFTNPRFNNKTLVQAVKLDNDRYAFINASIDPIDSTSKILAKQLIIVSIIILILAFISSYFIAKHISNPIVKINEQAKNLSKNKKVVFDDDSNIRELNELSTTLNYASCELAKADELKRDLMANVSHDLKTPLTMIKAYAEMTRDLHSNNKKKREEDMNIIIDETDRLTVLVNDILDLSKLQSDIEVINPEEFDLISLIDEILNRYKVFQELEDYKFIFNHKDKKIMVKADKIKIEQVIYNLVNNAINYTGDDKTVKINVTNNDGILVEIIDSGEGIKEEDIPYIWDKYYKNKKKHKRNLVGTGIGLSIVKNVLELHSYKYGVKSIRGKGSTFYFIIPKEKKL